MQTTARTAAASVRLADTRVRTLARPTRASVRCLASKKTGKASTPSSKGKASTPSSDAGSSSAVEGAIGAGGCLLNGIVLWSEYVLATTGSGLPPGPAGLLGAAEGIGYLAVVGIVGWSIKTKVSTGTGLPPGPAGLLGGAEGLSYFSLLGALVAFGKTFFEKGALPGITG